LIEKEKRGVEKILDSFWRPLYVIVSSQFLGHIWSCPHFNALGPPGRKFDLSHLPGEIWVSARGAITQRIETWRR
jgi:hypothetical protein